MTQGVYLGFDFGTKYIGIAVGQTVTQTASTLTTLAAKNGKPDLNLLRKIMDEWQPKGLVIGLPLQPDNSHSPTSRAALAFGKFLQKQFELPIYYIEERLTTVAAKERLKSLYPDSYYQQDVDAMSAVIILESWFHSQL